MSTFSQNRVWHSFLKTKSPLVMRFTSAPIPSKFDENQTIVYIMVRGDDTEGRYLVIENDTIRGRIENAPQGVWLSVTATGTDTNDADISIEATDDAAPTGSSGGGGTKSSFANQPVLGAADLATNYQTCFETAMKIVAESDYPRGLKKAVSDSDSFADMLGGISSTLFINWARTGFKVPLSEDMLPESVTVDSDKAEEASKPEEPVAAAPAGSDDDLPF